MIFARSAAFLAVAAVAVAAGVAVLASLSGDYFRSPVRLGAYIVLPAAVALVGSCCLAAGSRARALFVTYAAAGLVGVLAAEVILRTRGLPEAQVLGGAGETDHAATERMRREGQRAFPHLCAALAPATGRGAEPTSPVRVDGESVQILTGLANNVIAVRSGIAGSSVRTDAFGFNNPPGQWESANVRAAVVGDSFAFGVGAPHGDGFVDRIRSLVGITVNLGCGGNGPLSELASLVEYGRALKPAVVVWAYFEGNDLPKDLPRELSTALLPRYLEPGFTQNLRARRDKIDAAIEVYLRAQIAPARPPAPPAARGPALAFASVASLEYLRTELGMVNGYRSGALKLFERILARARTEAAGWGGIVFVYIPAQTRYSSAIARWDADGYKRDVLAAARRLGIETIDLDDEFGKAGRDPATLFSGHFTPEGHRLAGELIANRLLPHLR